MARKDLLYCCDGLLEPVKELMEVLNECLGLFDGDDGALRAEE